MKIKFIAISFILVSICFLNITKLTAKRELKTTETIENVVNLWYEYLSNFPKIKDTISSYNLKNINDGAGIMLVDTANIPNNLNDEQYVLLVLKDRYREVAKEDLGGNGDYKLYFLIDDFIQIEFNFKADKKLIGKTVVKKREYWLKNPWGLIHDTFTKEDL